MSSPTKKRFIAGATCPKCGAIDTLQMYRDDDVATYECVRCAYVEHMYRDQGDSDPVKIIDIKK